MFTTVLILLAAIAVIVGLVLAARPRAGLHPDDLEKGLPHDCEPGTFVPQVETSTEYVGRKAGQEYGLVVFRRLFCSVCKQDLFCAVCQSTPRPGAIIGGSDEIDGILNCCDPPEYMLRLTEPEAGSNVIRFPGMNPVDRSSN